MSTCILPKRRSSSTTSVAVYAVVRLGRAASYWSHNLTPGLDFDSDVNIISKLNNAPLHSKEVYFDERFSTALHRSNYDNWEKLFGAEFEPKLMKPAETIPPVQTLRFESALNAQAGSLPVGREDFVPTSFAIHR